MNQPIARPQDRAAAGFTLIELIVSTAIMMVIVGATMTALNEAVKTNQTALQLTSMNNTLRIGLDLMVRDLLQVGQGLPSGRVIQNPSGAGAVQINLPGPPMGAGVTTTYKNVAGDPDTSAVTPGWQKGPIINGVRTDMITVLEGDGSFERMNLTALNNQRMTVALPPGVGTLDISTNGPNDVLAGQLMMLVKGTNSTLVQVTRVDGAQTAFFEANDSLLLNQTAAAAGSITAVLNAAPAAVGGNDVPSPPSNFVPTTAYRIRMISYYIDAVTSPEHPRLIRRMNNGDPMTFNNNLGNVVAFDVENLRITYDIADGVTNPSGVNMTPNDQAGTGACAPNPCNMNQIRKVNIVLSGRSRLPIPGARVQFLHNQLQTQVSLRSLAFVDRYR